MKYIYLLLPLFLCASEENKPQPPQTKPPLVRRDRIYFGSLEGVPIEQIINNKRPRIVVQHPGKEEEKK